MPLNLENFSGTWKLSKKSDNLAQVMQKLGEPQALIENMDSVEVVVDIKASGNTYTMKYTVMGKASESTFTLGTECDDPITPNKKATHTIDGDALMINYSNHDGKGLVVRKTRRLVDANTARTEYKIGDLEGFYEAKKI
ncbi:fatty acid-binding protein, liver-like [Branchiostoma lanceolatum]|uniref:fatty acid-binding protein, liver-like n=1 Tax=Branchiostoma lanceolatum TaxID=7740 RepID=UPI003451EA73